MGVSAYGREDLVTAAALLLERAESASQVISDVVPLEKAGTALRACRSGEMAGKVLLDCR